MRVVQCLKEGPQGFVCTRARSHPGAHVAGTSGSFTIDTVGVVWLELEPGSPEYVDALEESREERDALSAHL